MPDAPLGGPAVGSTAGLSLFGTIPDQGAAPICSRKGCRAGAAWRLLWNNPRIHTPDRRKVWASCPDHVEWFEEYLRDRGLWKETRPLTDENSDENTGGSIGGMTGEAQ
ncbi:Uncharacterised protein [Arthrobacter agilis]|uniref:hypothetical protein n=1 Tax=Arthrobacter agilis TaxID=37921 RepID=UPI000F6B784E|nr:hypothetical protein [Arthrobacter agilis]VDR32043.1 Uncharacterised protein [Arthrobacter agilis]